MLDEVIAAHPVGKAKLRVWIEFQYSESFEFFSLFNRIDSATTGPNKEEQLYYALQYQEYVRDERAEQKQRAVPFPKVLIIEHLEQACTPLTNYVRIYERSSLDNFCPQTSAAFAQSRLAFLFLEGSHTN